MLKRDGVETRERNEDRRESPVPRRRKDDLLAAVIAHQQIGVVFQPQIDPASGEVAGAEALARWDRVAGAEQLFARAAAAGLSEPLSRLVQFKALRAAAAWEGPLRRLRVSINLLPEDILQDNYVDWLIGQINSVGIDPKRVTIEITENALLSDLEAVAERLTRIRQEGIKVALDDFGTGYASLSYLGSLPLDALKIDRGLVARIGTSERDRIVVRSIFSLARDLGLTVIVEGVECTSQLVLLAEWGCDLYQGFLGAGALDEVELSRFVAVSQANAA
ncbi:EAL domain-containing protein [Sphingomonas sediminicola]|jgi:EAL domain-containing protein (putative c-di-GMP-specific phosphodiesterase class I)|uniref:EAL domain-containing protein n=1 Tax=Sphingomonas sediminicola TaxID=386874 RepID=A0ABX6TAD4_9SPHN|nr:EAL domain-containing protein [Sphingomonas sediminicola]QNP46750.1 EAL domain-containing protein [Sphingomonas sediminicola]